MNSIPYKKHFTSGKSARCCGFDAFDTNLRLEAALRDTSNTTLLEDLAFQARADRQQRETISKALRHARIPANLKNRLLAIIHHQNLHDAGVSGHLQPDTPRGEGVSE